MSKEPPHNLLLVQPYHWKPFSGFADINNSAGADLSKTSSSSKRDDSKSGLAVETDKQLLWTQYILERVHSRYYARNGKMTVPDILKEMRHETLRGCRIVLSGLVPLHKQQDDYKGPRHPLLRYTESMGAKLLTTIDPSLTHVVASADGTEKIVRARKIPGCYIVRASWLMESYWSLKRSRELDHVLGSPPAVIKPWAAANGSATLAASNSTDDDDDDEDDDFADALWG
jgi:RNA polymerase II subunit A-like phosphatase